MASQFGSAVENILTKGLDAAATVFTAKYQVNDPAPKVASRAGPGSVTAGQSAGFSAVVASVPTWVWAAGGAGLLLLLVPKLLRR